MNEFTVHPAVYATGPSTGLVDVLAKTWVDGRVLGDGDLYLVSGFGNYNGGVRFFEAFASHVKAGGRVSAIFAGSTSARLTSRQLVQKLLDCGVSVTLVNRKRLLHAKLYGSAGVAGDRLVVSSGNFTGPGMAMNVEASLFLDEATTASMGFAWSVLHEQLSAQSWDYYMPSLSNSADPAWDLLYDEVGAVPPLEETDLLSMVVVLGHADVARIVAAPGTNAGKGSQYFWLSKDSYGFFPPLTIPNKRGVKPTYSALIEVDFVDIKQTEEVRVTFEAGNNLDFRLGTGPLRHSGVADIGDLGVITRRSDRNYEIRIARAGTAAFGVLAPYALTFVGHSGKRYGMVPNSVVDGAFP